jgi:leucyl-tRNA synthetase
LAKGKGKGLLFDPTKDKALNIYVAKSWPPWQQRYVDLVREQLDGGVSLDVKSVATMIAKADMKRAMPFIQDLKRRLEESGESTPDAVLDRILGFDEVEVLKEMVPVLKSTVPKLKRVNVIVVDDMERGQNEASGNTGGNGVVEVPQPASSTEPGNPSLEFFIV